MLKIRYFLYHILYPIWRKGKFIRHNLYIKNLVAKGLKLGKNVTIATTAWIDDEYCYLISIGANCTISHHVRLLAHDASTFNFTENFTRIGKVEIKDNCYFGENVIVLPGVTIGPNVLVAAGSVVNKDIPPNSCVAGVPARFYAKFDDFIENHKNRIKERPIFKYTDLFGHFNEKIKKKVIESVQNGDAYVKGYLGKFPTTFNIDEKWHQKEIMFNNEVFNDFAKLHPWMVSYASNVIKNAFTNKKMKPKDIFLCICDHFEPLGGGVSTSVGLQRIKNWCERYPAIAEKYKDSDGCIPKYTFFYPTEEYHTEFMLLLAELCLGGYGEVEIHIHHANDTADNLRKTLTNFKNKLANEYGLLAKDKHTNVIKYGFIHGNWALDNSHPKGFHCGVNNEINILRETDCYADFTMPSAPDVTQTTKINSIYYAVDNPLKPKSHNSGINARVGRSNPGGLLMIQGPLMLNWKRKKWRLFPHIENGCIGADYPVDLNRIKLWIDAGINVSKRLDYVFIKLYTHGCQEQNMNYLLNGGLDSLFSYLKEYCRKQDYQFHYVTARELVNIVKGIEDNISLEDNTALRNYKLILANGKL
jgi:acetyltransferase-like isoleucine patch superfamily enzyme